MVVVLFEVTVKEEKMEDYLSRAALLKELLAHEEGFISAERFSSLSTKGKLLSLSGWMRRAQPAGGTASAIA